MLTKLKEERGCTVAGFVEAKRFTLAITEDVKTELKPVFNKQEAKLVLDLKNIEFIDSSGIGCIISLVKTAKSNGGGLKLCNLSKDVVDIFELLHMNMILDIEQDVESAVQNFNN